MTYTEVNTIRNALLALQKLAMQRDSAYLLELAKKSLEILKNQPEPEQDKS